MRRLLILTAREIDDLYGLPCFTNEDRRLYFDLSPVERQAVDAIHTTSAAVHLTLQLGYFKAKRRFLAPREGSCDVRHEARRWNE